MGIFKLFSNSSSPPPNPDPTRFRIVSHYEKPPYTVLEVHYPDATTFEGVKILVYRLPWSVLQRRKVMDPHFTDQEDHGPVARFEPTELGRELAAKLVEE